LTPINNNLPIVIIACKVMQEMLERQVPADLDAEINIMDFGLHESPRKMTPVLQDRIDHINQPSLVVLIYGLCGNGLDGLWAGEHTLLLPRVHDCMSLFLGSRTAYLREAQTVPGTYYLNKTWLEENSGPLGQYEKYMERYGQEKALQFLDMEYKNYERLLLIASSPQEMETCRPNALEHARLCQRWGMRFEETLGSDIYVQNLLSIAMGRREVDDDFLLITPGGQVQQLQFLD